MLMMQVTSTAFQTVVRLNEQAADPQIHTPSGSLIP